MKIALLLRPSKNTMEICMAVEMPLKQHSSQEHTSSDLPLTSVYLVHSSSNGN